MSNPLISVITVSFNSAQTIAKTLDSLKEQTCRDFESIVIDGNSTDGTQDIVQSFDDLVRQFVSEPDKGIYDAMNKGIDLATGRYISFLNSDDRYPNHTIQTILDINSDRDILYGNMIKERKLNGKIYTRKVKPDLSSMEQTMSVFHPSIFVRRELFNQLGKFSLKYSLAADYHWVLKAYLQGIRFEYIDSPLAIFSVGGVSNFTCASYKEAAEIQKELGLPHEAMLNQHLHCKRKMIRNRLISRIARLPILKTIYENRIKKNWS